MKQHEKLSSIIVLQRENNKPCIYIEGEINMVKRQNYEEKEVFCLH